MRNRFLLVTCYNEIMTDNLLPLFLLMSSGVFLSAVFDRLHLPWVITLIAAGLLLGPYGLSLVSVSPALELMSEIGLVFLMFMAGLETRFSSFRKTEKGVLLLSLFNAGIPFLVGFLLGFVFAFSIPGCFLLGMVFISSSIGVITPSLEATELIETEMGQLAVATSIVQDVLSLLLLSVAFQTTQRSLLPIVVLYPLAIALMVVLRMLLPELHQYFAESTQHNLFQREVRTVFLILLGTVIAFELLGLHPIVGGFFAGVILSDFIRSELLEGKLRAISYGIFIPLFFLSVGMQTNLRLVFGGALVLTTLVVLGSIGAKFASGVLGARLLGFDMVRASLFGASSIPQLSTTLAVAFSGRTLGLFDQNVVASLVALSIASTFVGPLLVGLIGRRIKLEQQGGVRRFWNWIVESKFWPGSSL